MTQWIAGIAAALAVAAPSAQDKPKLAGNRADEPVAQEFSLRKAVDFMDSAARMWNTKYKCVTCHTNGLYLAARAPASTKAAAYLETRKFASDYLKDYVSKGMKPKGQRGAIEGIVATTSFLTISDMATKGRLSSSTKKSLDYVWQQQGENGAWDKWLKCRWPPYEIDDHFGVTLAGLALSRTPRSYRRSKVAKRAERRLRSYLSDHPPANLHQKGMMLWLAASLDDVVDSKQSQDWVTELRELQREDGGWRLRDLGDSQWKRPKDADADLPSDAYATGFAVFALRQAGQAPDHQTLQRGLTWLRENQRQSGRWFVRSPRRDGKHFISHAATQFAVMAFLACGESAAEKKRR